MSIPFYCPHCQTFTEVDEQFAGQSGPCVACGKMITLPSLLEVEQGEIAFANVRPSTTRLWIWYLTFGGAILGSVLVGIAFIAFVLSTVAPAITAARSKAQRAACLSNLQRIGQALQSYSDEHGVYPPAYIPDENGRPMHSWRVLILPYLGENQLYQQYDFDTPWDSAANLRATQYMPDVFACPQDPTALAKSETTYMVVVGSKTMFPGAESVSFGDIHDGSNDTIMLLEVHASGVTWTKPEDLDFNKMAFQANTGPADMGSSHTPNGAHALLADGEVLYLTDKENAETVQAMLTIAGEEIIDARVFDNF